jgi:cell division protein ZapA (FtsZ GTPase activity inhibitor)
MSGPKIPISVRIGGEEHVLRSDADPEHTLRCARLVDQRIAEIRGRVGALEGPRVAILAGLSLADELFQLRDEHARLQDELAVRSHELVRRVEAVLAAGEADGPALPSRGDPR